MICPYCHNENKLDALTCDFCMHVLPMNKGREKEIKTKKSQEKKSHFHNSIVKLIGTLLGVCAIAGIIIVMWVIKKRG